MCFLRFFDLPMSTTHVQYPSHTSKIRIADFGHAKIRAFLSIFRSWNFVQNPHPKSAPIVFLYKSKIRGPLADFGPGPGPNSDQARKLDVCPGMARKVSPVENGHTVAWTWKMSSKKGAMPKMRTNWLQKVHFPDLSFETATDWGNTFSSLKKPSEVQTKHIFEKILELPSTWYQ